MRSGPDVDLPEPPRGEEVPSEGLQDFKSEEALGQGLEGGFGVDGLEVKLSHAEDENREGAEEEQKRSNAGGSDGKPPEH